MVPSQPFAERLTKRDRPRRLLLTVLTRPVRPVLAVLPTPCSSSTQTRLLVCGLTPLLSWSWLLASSSLLLLCMSLRNSPPSSLLKSMFFNIILCSLSLSLATVFSNYIILRRMLVYTSTTAGWLVDEAFGWPTNGWKIKWVVIQWCLLSVCLFFNIIYCPTQQQCLVFLTVFFCLFLHSG